NAFQQCWAVHRFSSPNKIDIILCPLPRHASHGVPGAAPLRRRFSSKKATSTSSSVMTLPPWSGAQGDDAQGWLGRVSSYTLSFSTTLASCALCVAILVARLSLCARVSSWARAMPLALLIISSRLRIRFLANDSFSAAKQSAICGSISFIPTPIPLPPPPTLLQAHAD